MRLATINDIKDNCIVSDDNCWNWIGATASGYGRIKHHGKLYSVHRLSFQIHNPNVKIDGLDVCHTCDNPKCCNPQHLFAGTRSDNMKDCSRKRRLASQNGKHVKPKLGPEFISVIKEMKRNGLSKRQIAKQLGWVWASYQRYEKRYSV